VRKTKTIAGDGRDYLAIAPKGNVPAVSLPDGGLLTESSAVLQYVADKAPASNLAPPPGSPERYRLAEWLNFISSELHKKHLAMAFSTKTSPEVKAWARETAPDTLAFVENHLKDHEYLLGDHFTVADTYLFWALLVAPHGGIPTDKFPSLTAYVTRIRKRPSVMTALAHDYPLFERESK
jgi:glutathione S-transferase